METSPSQNTHRKLIGRLLAVVAAAFAFGFALVPLYDVLCAATGFNGKSDIKRDGFGVGGLASAPDDRAPPSRIDHSRTVAVEFTGTVMPGLAWDMRPLTFSLEVHPGEMHQVRYLVRNTSDHTITGQAIPSVSPGKAAQHFDKVECFCFAQQTLAPGESKELPLTFIVKPEIDKDIRHVTLSYAFFNAVKEKTAANIRE